MRLRPIVAIALFALLTGCSSVVGGSGRASTPTATGPTGFPASGSGGPTGSAVASGSGGPTGSTGGPVPSGLTRFPRHPVDTAIGDPSTADLCAAIGLTTLSGFGYQPQLSPEQLPPGCSIRLTRGGSRIGSFAAYASTEPPVPASGRTVSTVAGLQVYSYPYLSDGDCERDVIASGVVLAVHAFPTEVPAAKKQSVACGGATAIARRLALRVTDHAMPRLALATPSLTSMDGCAVVRASRIPSLPRFAGFTTSPDGFGTGCALSKGSVSYYFDFAVTAGSTLPDMRAVSAGSHRIYADGSNGPQYCIFTSIQGGTPGGGHELVTASGGTGTADTSLCPDLQQAFVDYLDTAGLH